MDNPSTEPILAENIPVSMPELPVRLRLTTVQQFKALGDATRWRMLTIIQHRPATAKQLASILQIAPGTATHHLQVLEEAGLAMVVARRLIHGIIAKYYTRTARIFLFDFPSEISDKNSMTLDILEKAREEVMSSLASGPENHKNFAAFPHTRLSPQRAQYYSERLSALLDEFLEEPSTDEGEVYGLCLTFFESPPYLQAPSQSASSEL